MNSFYTEKKQMGPFIPTRMLCWSLWFQVYCTYRMYNGTGFIKGHVRLSLSFKVLKSVYQF